MIARIWRGVVRLEDAGAGCDRRDEGERTEFVTLSFWESRDAIRGFAGDETVRHYDIVRSAG